MTVNARQRSRRLRSRDAFHVPDFNTLVPAPELSLVNAKKLSVYIQLWSRDENVEIRYVNGSSVAETLASSPSVPYQMQLQVLK